MNRKAIDQARYCLRAFFVLNRRKRSADSLGQKDSFFPLYEWQLTKQWYWELVMIRHSLENKYFVFVFVLFRFLWEGKKKREVIFNTL